MDAEKMRICAKNVDSQKQEMIRLLSKLIAADTTNPPGNERRAANVVKEFFIRNRIRYRIFEKEKGRANIIGYIGKGKPGIIIACHLDTVPAGEGWKTNPFKAKVRGDRIYGRGAVDNKGPLAGVLVAGGIVKKTESRLRGQIILACVADEERGSQAGMKYLLDAGKIRAKYAIVPDIEHELKRIDVAEKGLLFLKVTSFGKQAHGSTPDKGVNAAWNMIEFLNLLKKYRMKYRKHSLLSPPTMNLGIIKAGNAPNMVPGECEAQIDIRYLPSQKTGDIIRDVKGMLAGIERRDGKAKFRFEVVDNQPPVDVGEDNGLVTLIKKHVKAVVGKEATTIGISGTTLIKPLAEKGILAVGFSPGKGMAHMANEFISIKETMDFSKTLCLVCLDLLK